MIHQLTAGMRLHFAHIIANATSDTRKRYIKEFATKEKLACPSEAESVGGKSSNPKGSLPLAEGGLGGIPPALQILRPCTGWSRNKHHQLPLQGNIQKRGIRGKFSYSKKL